MGQSFVEMNGVRQKKCQYESKITIEEMKAQFKYDVGAIIEMENVPDELVINWDHTGINYVPTSSWTMAGAQG